MEYRMTADCRMFVIRKRTNGLYEIYEDCGRDGCYKTYEFCWNPTPVFNNLTVAVKYLKENIKDFM